MIMHCSMHFYKVIQLWITACVHNLIAGMSFKLKLHIQYINIHSLEYVP